MNREEINSYLIAALCMEFYHRKAGGGTIVNSKIGTRCYRFGELFVIDGDFV